MIRILYAQPSPYSAKVRMAATLAQVPFEAVPVDAGAEPEILIDANPLGKIPVLLTEDGFALYDSRAITQYLNRISRNAVFPRNAVKRTEAECMEALADGITDCLLAHVYERRFHPPDKVHQPWLDRQWAKVERALDRLNAEPPKLGRRIHCGHIALRAVLGYLELRFGTDWMRGRTRLKNWMKRFDAKHPDLVALLPAAS